MRRKSEDVNVIALSITDVHLSHKPPLARSCEGDWYGVMAGYLDQVRALATKYQVPLIIPGDIFDKPSPPVELVNFAITHLPQCYAVPGQHDLPYHSYKDIRKSAYWNLVQAKVITNLDPGEPVELDGIRLHGFPWGYKVKPCKSEPHDLVLDIAVIHSYVWSQQRGTGYPGAPKEKTIGAYKKALRGYDIALFGDNHLPFDARAGDCCVYNGGSFVRRKSDEKKHKPRVGLIYSDGTVKGKALDVSKDRFVDFDKTGETLNGIGAQTFLEELGSLTDAAVSFSEAVNRLIARDKVPEDVKRLVLTLLEKGGSRIGR